MTSGSRLEKVGSRLSWCSVSFWSLPDDEVDDAREGSSGCCLAGPTLLCC
jgi:hypothetical protein